MKLLSTVAVFVLMLASAGAGSAAPDAPKQEALTLRLGQAKVFQDNRLVLRMLSDGTLEGLERTNLPGNAKLATDGTLSWGGEALLRITHDKLVELATNRSLAIHTVQDAARMRIFAGNFKFELAADGKVLFHNGEKEDRSIRIEGEPEARRTAFVVLVHAALFMKVKSQAQQPRPASA